MYDLISIGDSTIDTLIQIQDAQISCDINQENCKLCVPFGEKIPVEKLVHFVAGNAANNAVAATKLGLKTAIYTNVGSDSSGKEIIARLKEEKVDIRYIMQHQDMESNFSAVINFKGDRTIFVYHQDWKYKLPELERTKWMYYTSVAQSFVNTDLNQDITRYIQRTGAKLVFNPGTYQLKQGVKKYPQILSLTHLLIVNKQEAEKILGVKMAKGMVDIRKLLTGLHDLGPANVIITDNKNGSFSTDGERIYHLGIFPAKVVDMTGAGDSYATGVLSALFYGKDLPEAMRWGAANSASAIETIGAQFGILTYSELQEKLKENSRLKTSQVR